MNALRHRQPSRIKQHIPEIPESWYVTFIGFVWIVIIVLSLVFFLYPAMDSTR